jgi:hypothetical protein
VGNPGYTIPTTVTAEMGDAFLKSLTPAQAAIVTGLVDAQRPSLYEIVDRREDVSTLLRQFMTGRVPDRDTVLTLMERYGELDGDIVFCYATVFAQVATTLSDAQRAHLTTLRADLLGGLAFPSGAYLYSQPIAVPQIPNTSFLFDVP